MLVVWYSVVLLLLHQPGDITASLRWPGGIYGLPKPETGCPEEWKNNEWGEYGWMSQETEQRRTSNDKSNDLHMDGFVKPREVKINFCISKTTTSVQPHQSKRPTWPKGEYCIYSKLSIPNMSRGRIYLYDGYSRKTASKTCIDSFLLNRNAYRYLYFACQTRGDKKIPISLPITKPFYLLPYESRDCQQVKWMLATTEWIKEYTYNYYQYGKIPHRDLKPYYRGKEIKMYYCYYKSCNYTLTNTTGVFQSPGFPGEYPDGQLCSWRIMVPDNHTLHVHFTNFSLYEYDKDCLQLYENNSRIFKHRQAFFGQQPPFTITATSDVMFVFRSDEENNSTGFRANYTMFKTPTNAPPKTTAHSTTTIKPTTEHITTQPTTTKQPTTTEATTTFPTTTNETVQCNPITTKNKSQYIKGDIHPLKKTCFCEETWRIVVMVIPLVVFILIVLVIIDIFCRCRSKKASKSGTNGTSVDDGMVVNPTYEQGNIILDQTTETTTDASTVNTVDEQPQSRDEPPDYEDVDYTQLNEIPPPRRSIKRQECHALEPVGYDTPDVFYHVLEHPNIESSDGPQCHVREPHGNGAPEVFYHTPESPTDLNRPTYQNLSEFNHHTLKSVYESA